MTKIEVLYEGYDDVTSLSSIYKEEDLQLRPGLNISPPPSDGRCQGCGRHLSELKPFNRKDGFEGSLLVKNYRHRWYPDDEFEEMVKEFPDDLYPEDDYETFENFIVKKYGIRAEGIYEYYIVTRPFKPSWECRDCYRLSHKEFFQLVQLLRPLDPFNLP